MRGFPILAREIVHSQGDKLHPSPLAEQRYRI